MMLITTDGPWKVLLLKNSKIIDTKLLSTFHIRKGTKLNRKYLFFF